MSELALPLIGTALGCFTGGIFTYVIGKRMLSDEKILDKLDMILDEYTNNEEGMRKIYMIGGVLGKGLRDGVGLNRLIPKKKGGLEGIIFDLVGGYINKHFVGEETNGKQEIVPPEHQLERPWR